MLFRSSVIINGTTVAVPAGPNNTVKGLCDAINSAAITGVYAAVNAGKLVIFADSTATADGSTADEGAVNIENGTGTPLAALGITANTYYAPAFLADYSYNVPRWRTTDVQPEPTGSVWQKINNVNLGTNLVLKKWSSTLGVWVQQSVPIYTFGTQATYALDPSGGGINIPVGTTWARTNPSWNSPDTAGFEIVEFQQAGATVVTGATVPTGNAFTPGNEFTIQASIPGQQAVKIGRAHV